MPFGLAVPENCDKVIGGFAGGRVSSRANGDKKGKVLAKPKDCSAPCQDKVYALDPALRCKHHGVADTGVERPCHAPRVVARTVRPPLGVQVAVEELSVFKKSELGRVVAVHGEPPRVHNPVPILQMGAQVV